LFQVAREPTDVINEEGWIIARDELLNFFERLGTIFTYCGESNLYGIVDAHIPILENEVLGQE
jgi:hypothetical protein